MDNPPKKPDKQALREIIRSKRRHLSKEEQEMKAKALISVLATVPEYTISQKIAAYWPIECEISPIPLLGHAMKKGKHCYLPILHPLNQKQLWFVEYKAEDPLTPNRFGIPEPSLNGKKLISARNLEVVFVPLVAFDAKGKRLGMGQGYYDATFAFLKNRPFKKPLLIGLAYEFQEVSDLPIEAWDIPLYGIATEREYRKFS
jgi:5-formyltetrahydrofolate cyclo-ligase